MEGPTTELHNGGARLEYGRGTEAGVEGDAEAREALTNSGDRDSRKSRFASLSRSGGNGRGRGQTRGGDGWFMVASCFELTQIN